MSTIPISDTDMLTFCFNCFSSWFCDWKLPGTSGWWWNSKRICRIQ